MIELHERLSEFSYGYGVTREAEVLLESVGLRAVPFLPNLIQENDLGFDVAFDRPGAALLLQFKLGQSLQRFRRTDPAMAPPVLNKPFWRFSIDTAEPDGQFETLLKAEQDGAETYYTAPRFSDWPHYGHLFERREVLENSLLVRPSEIRAALDAQGAPDGPHRIVYDRYRVHVCSEPTRVAEVNADDAVAAVANAVRSRDISAGQALDRVLVGFEHRREIRRGSAKSDMYENLGDDMAYRAPDRYAHAQRSRRLEGLSARAKSREHAIAAAVGLELWSLGIQLIVATEIG